MSELIGCCHPDNWPVSTSCCLIAACTIAAAAAAYADVTGISSSDCRGQPCRCQWRVEEGELVCMYFALD